jgi:putative DNA primase/helicase
VQSQEQAAAARRQEGRANKPIKGTGGVSAASTDPDQVTAWWKKWPQALIGLACGHPTKGTETPAQPAGLSAVRARLRPAHGSDTGEVWTLERLKRETEEQLGCALPVSMAALTPSDGVHLYLLKGDDGPAITNRGNLPAARRRARPGRLRDRSAERDERAKGAGLRYRWHRASRSAESRKRRSGCSRCCASAAENGPLHSGKN